MLLTTSFWICACIPGYALARRLWPSVHEAGLLAVIAFSMLGSFVLLSPVSIACYALGAPLAAFSAALVAAVVLGLGLCVRDRADRDLLACARGEPAVGWILLGGLLWLQARLGGYFDGDATFHVGRMRVLVEHGFTNRDIYLADDYFQHVYHTNLLYPIYASAGLLTGQTYLEAWFHSQAWAKLLVAAGHYALGYGVARRRLAGFLLALAAITANAGETYTVYPNTVAVGWLLPLMLGVAYALLGAASNAGRLRWADAAAVAAISFVLGQVHGLYAFYAGLVIAPALAIACAWPALGARRGRLVLALAGTLAAVPFLLVSQYAFRPAAADPGAGAVAEEEEEAAEEEEDTAEPRVEPAPAPPPAPRRLPDVKKGQPAVPTPAVAAGGGHLEKSLELDPDTVQVWFEPRNMGGKGFVALGCAGLLFAFAMQRDRRAPLVAAGLGAALLASALFVPRICTFVLELLRQPFIVARLSTILSSLLLLGIAAALAELVARVEPRLPALRWLPSVLVLVLATAAATRLTGHAPMFFSEVVERARAPQELRHAKLERLEARRQLLADVVPRGATILTTARFARMVVMICDCYVIIADRGHTYLPFARDRRLELRALNGPRTPWPERLAHLRRYGLELVVFESRHLRRLYPWTLEHGRVIGEVAGLRVVKLRGVRDPNG